MPVRRALVDGAVLSLQDPCLFYPCCKVCFSKIDLQQRDTLRVKCFQCGSSSVKEQVDYRYRLALRVARDRHIFGVTVFGSCLNRLFGIPASGLQRLLEDSEEPTGTQTRFALLIQAVKDCFIGRHFIFGIKVPHADEALLFGGQQGGPTPIDSKVTGSKGPVHFIASQIIPPKATGGSSVVNYYRALLNKADEHPLECTGPRTAFIPLMPPHRSPPSSFHSTLLGSCLLSQSLPRSVHHDRTLRPTPPWQQSLGLVTSSAEQEEEGGGEMDRSVHDVAVWLRDCWQDCDGDAKRRVSSPLQSLYQHHSPASPIRHQGDGNTPVQHTWYSPSLPCPSMAAPLGPGGRGGSQGGQDVQMSHSNTSLSGSVVWEDMPFSESLAEFLCDENEKLDRISEMERMLIVPRGRERTGDNAPLGDSSNTRKSSTEAAVPPNNAPPLIHSDTHSHGGILLYITKTTALSYGGDFTSNSGNQACGDVHWNLSQTGDIHSSIRKREGHDEEEEIRPCDGEGVYDCSADLFGGSLMASVTQTVDAQADTQAPDARSHADTQPTRPRPNAQHWKDGQTDASDTDLSESSSLYDQHSCLPDTADLKSREDAALLPKEPSHLRDTEDLTNIKKAATDVDQCKYSLCLDFIPSSQSTPLMTRAAPRQFMLPGAAQRTPRRFMLPGAAQRTPRRFMLPGAAQRTPTPREPDSQPGSPCVSHQTLTGRGNNDNPRGNKFRVDPRRSRAGRRTELTQASSATPPSHRLTPKRGCKRTFRRLEQEPKRILVAQQRTRLEKRSPSRGLSRRTDNPAGGRKLCDTSVCDKSVCDSCDVSVSDSCDVSVSDSCDVSVSNDIQDNSMMVPPSTNRTRRLAQLRLTDLQRLQTDNCAKDFTSTQVNCKRTLLYQTTPPPPPRTGLVHHRQTGSGPEMSGDEVGDCGSVHFALHDESRMCDWSRDLFSDSF